MFCCIREIVNYEVEKFNMSNDKLKIIVSNDNLSNITAHGLGYDYRLMNKNLKNTSITMRFVNKVNCDILLISTIILYDTSSFNGVRFWYYDKRQNSLKKTSLSDVQEQVGIYAMTLGYSQTAYKFTNNYIITKFYVNTIKEILERTNIFTFAEPTGIESLSKNLTNLDTILLDENMDINSLVLGETRQISKPSNKLMKILNFNKLEDIYNLFTLGSVFSNKKIIF